MRLTTQKDALLEALSKGGAAATRRANLEILGYVLLTAEAGKLTITSTDLDAFVIAECKANIGKKGAVTVPAELLVKMVKRLKTGMVTIESKTTTTDKMVTSERWDYETKQMQPFTERLVKVSSTFFIVAGNVRMSLDSRPAKDFPNIPKIGKGKGVSLKSLGDAIKSVSYAAATEETRPVLCGVYLHSTAGKVKVVATDSNRMAIATVNATGKLSKNIILPVNNCKLIQTLFPGNVQAILIGKTEQPLVVFHQNNGVRLISRTIAGTYPSYEALVPKPSRKSYEVNTSELSDAVKTLTEIKPDNDAIRMVGKKGKLHLVAKNTHSEITIDIPAKGIFQIAFSGKYITDVLKQAGEKFKMQISNAQSPGVVRIGNTVHIIMPILVPWG